MSWGVSFLKKAPKEDGYDSDFMFYYLLKLKNIWKCGLTIWGTVEVSDCQIHTEKLLKLHGRDR